MVRNKVKEMNYHTQNKVYTNQKTINSSMKNKLVFETLLAEINY